ncbi:MAG: NAD-dependent epimerase/dehydratase family protein [Gammaproteobacteria bacterium]|jgi:GDP-L-fucose synthase|nr:NAD-dependent epimerase/dehydratase family protein [Gammaproteobacteria bacterium]
MSNFFKDKNILVTGGTGLIGRPLVEKLVSLEAKVTVVSLDKPTNVDNSVNFINLDLRNFENCISVCKDKEIVFNLIGVKGSPKMTMENPASFFVPTITFSINMMEAARQCGVERYLFTSSIGVYEPADIFNEDDVWSTFPSENDRFAGWAKRMGELQAQAYDIQYNWDKISIVRPANVYGPYDNFDPKNAMVIPSLINRASSGERPLTVWGDGSPIRDFIYSEDVADGMLEVVRQGYNKPINLGSGNGVSIKEIATAIANKMSDKCEIVWDISKPSGDNKRIMSTERAESIGISPKILLDEGIESTIKWYNKHKNKDMNRYNAFTDKVYTKK